MAALAGSTRAPTAQCAPKVANGQIMTVAILSIGTALPPTVIDQAEALRLGRVLCARSPEQATWLPGLYSNTGIDARHLVLGRDVIDDILSGTRASGSVFLPSQQEDDHGPTTGQRMEVY